MKLPKVRELIEAIKALIKGPYLLIKNLFCMYTGLT